MEFFLVPLVAIAVVTFGIYKLAGLFFHIRLSRGLLAMLVGFAWLISLVLPAMFYHSVGFAGSVWISLVCAAGFAWMATLYDTKIRLGQLAANAAEFPPLQEKQWTPAAETTSPVLVNPLGGVLGNQQNETTLPEIESSVTEEGQTIDFSESRSETAVIDRHLSTNLEEFVPGAAAEQDASAPSDVIEVSAFVRSESEELSFAVALEDAIAENESTSETADKTSVDSERKSLGIDESGRGDGAFSEIITEANIATDVVQIGEVGLLSDVPEGQAERPNEVNRTLQTTNSTSLADLLEFAFEQRNGRNYAAAMEAFRQIREQYGDSDAIPLVEAELISTMQSCGDYTSALAELSLALELPKVSRDIRLIRTFEQKRTYLAALQDLLREQGKPNLPFEQIPAEWSDWLEWKVSAGANTQS